MTIAQKMADARIPVMEALHLAMRLAESLRVLHQNGGVHGALTPEHVELTASGVTLLPAAGPSAPSPYTAPEVAQGQRPNARADVYAFGAIVLEMLAGREALAARSSSGSPAVDRLLSVCLAPEPSARASRMQKVVLELKLLTVAARRAQAARARRERNPLDRMGEMESRLAVLEKAMDEVAVRAGQFERRFAGDLSTLKQNTLQQTAAINDARRTMAQTDEMVRRVVEALESLQTVVLDAVESGNKPVIPVN
jgi:hypothetical protein